MMDLYRQAEQLNRYVELHSSPEDPVLKELARHTYLKEVYPRMLSGHVLGSFLQLFSHLLAPGRILEVGTFTGYASICLARGLKPGGRLITLELNDELRDTALGFFEKAGLADRIELINGDALALIPELEGSFDLVFLDAHKEDYPAYYELLADRIPSGAYILADNVLWGGKVVDRPGTDSAAEALHRFNEIVTADPRVDNLLLPVRDGLMVIKRK